MSHGHFNQKVFVSIYYYYCVISHTLIYNSLYNYMSILISILVCKICDPVVFNALQAILKSKPKVYSNCDKKVICKGSQ